MTSVLKFLLLAISLILVSCNNSESASWDADPTLSTEESPNWVTRNFVKNKWRWNRLSSVTPKCTIFDSHNDNPFYCVKKACENARGNFNEQTYTCECNGYSSSLLFFTPLYGGACLPPRPASEKENFEKIKNRFLIENYTSNQFYHTEDYASSFKKKKLFKGSKSILIENIFVHQIKSQNSDPKELLGNLDLDRRKSGFALQTKVGKRHIYIVPESNEIKHHKAILATNYLNKNIQYNQFKMISDDGCRTQCYAEAWLEDEKGYIVLRDLFVEGQKVSSKVFFTLRKDLSTYYAMVTLDQTAKPNLVYIRKSLNPEPGIFEHGVDIFTASGEKLASNILISVPKEFSKRVKQKVGYPSNVTAGENMVSVCEWGINPFMLAENWDRVVFGPYTNNEDSFSGSVWGWHENLERNPHTYSKGYPQYELGYLPFELLIENPTHHRNVSWSILENSESATITVLDYADCTSADKNKNPLLMDFFPGRVVNLSAFSEVSGKSCQDKVKIVRETQDRLLWVLAAGNDSRDTCEQEFMRLPNVVSVTSINPSRPHTIEFGMQKGRKKIDTASFRTTKYGAGTSYAAPVVSAIAADIFSNYPQLQPFQVKRALVLGVDFQRLDVASGGRTDRNPALKAAMILSEDPNINRVELLTKIYKQNKIPSSYKLKAELRNMKSKLKVLSSSQEEYEIELRKLFKCLEHKDESLISKLESQLKALFKNNECYEVENVEIRVNEIQLKLSEIRSKVFHLETKQSAIENQLSRKTKYESHLKWIKQQYLHLKQ